MMEPQSEAEAILCSCFGGSVGTLSQDAIPFRNGLAVALSNSAASPWASLVGKAGNDMLLHRIAVFLTTQEKAQYSEIGRALLKMLSDNQHLPSMCARAQLLIQRPTAISDTSIAVSLLEKAEAAGSVEARILLSSCYANGTGVAKSPQVSHSLLLRAQNHPEAQYRLGCSYLTGSPELNYPTGIQFLMAAAEKKHPGACFELGNVLHRMSKAKQVWDSSLIEAVAQVRPSFAQLWTTAAEAGHPISQFNVACCYRSGTGVEKDDAKAMVWARRAAEQGYSRAQYYLGHSLLKKDTSDPTAIQWLLKAAEGGHAEAQLHLSQCFRTGTGTTKHMPLALQYLLAAADRGHPEAQHQLAVEYFAGASVPRSVEKGMVWLEKAADSGSKRSNRMISQCYYTGTALPKNEKKAFKHALVSAEGGDKLGMHNVAFCFANGIGVEKNKEAAEEWARRAAQGKAVPGCASVFITADSHLVAKGWSGEAPAGDVTMLSASIDVAPTASAVL